jgi:hypothetical protein
LIPQQDVYLHAIHLHFVQFSDDMMQLMTMHTRAYALYFSGNPCILLLQSCYKCIQLVDDLPYVLLSLSIQICLFSPSFSSFSDIDNQIEFGSAAGQGARLQPRQQDSH